MGGVGGCELNEPLIDYDCIVCEITSPRLMSRACGVSVLYMSLLGGLHYHFYYVALFNYGFKGVYNSF